MAAQVDPAIAKATEEFRAKFKAVKDEIGKAIVGHNDIVEGVLICLFTGGHALLEGVPGLGKTYLIRSMAEALKLEFSRVQFTPDLMPADIIGTNIIVEDPESGRRRFEFQKGPLFAQMVLADEINRATPKTQSALLEAMQEKTVTVSGNRYPLSPPFFVMATQNPIEQEGTYPLPEAQLDRFFFKLIVHYSTRDELGTILQRTTTGHKPDIKPVMSGDQIVGAQKLVQRVVIAPHVQDYAIRLTLATHPRGEFATELTNRYVRWGSSPRGAQAVVLAAKVRALLEGRYNVGFEDIRGVFLPALRHRVLLNFEAQAEGLEPDSVLKDIVDKTPTASEKAA
ncbi:MAG: MoxR family ATPase [Planctomycetia bacterium]|nr:MoxR family ATPase [Planctomycetia bacterium]MCC7315500.1 MoxR family ATPase [Planctomycetota bacterium]OQZ06628.1 MAG: AAA family ATPase [Planctomycetes bacterium UTPLA1]